MLRIVLSFVTLFVLLVTGCSSTPSSTQHQSVGYLSKGGHCEKLGEDAGSAVFIKHSSGQEQLDVGGGRKTEAYRFLAFVIGDDLKKRGWTTEETLAFSKDIYEASGYPNVDTEVLAAMLYFEVACEIEHKGIAVKRFPEVTQEMRRCLVTSSEKEQKVCARASLP